MKWLVDALSWIVNLFKTIWSFFLGLIDNLIMLVGYIGDALRLAYNMVDSLPDWLKVFALLTLTVTVLYLVLGRNTGGSQ